MPFHHSPLLCSLSTLLQSPPILQSVHFILKFPPPLCPLPTNLPLFLKPSSSCLLDEGIIHFSKIFISGSHFFFNFRKHKKPSFQVMKAWPCIFPGRSFECKVCLTVSHLTCLCEAQGWGPSGMPRLGLSVLYACPKVQSSRLPAPALPC